ncbi:hypothetical protein D3C75_728330 [compost metagenome]
MRLNPEIAEHAVTRTPRGSPGVLEQHQRQREVVVERAQQRRRQRHAAEVQMAAEGPARQRHASRPPAQRAVGDEPVRQRRGGHQLRQQRARFPARLRAQLGNRERAARSRRSGVAARDAVQGQVPRRGHDAAGGFPEQNELRVHAHEQPRAAGLLRAKSSAQSLCSRLIDPR